MSGNAQGAPTAPVRKGRGTFGKGMRSTTEVPPNPPATTTKSKDSLSPEQIRSPQQQQQQSQNNSAASAASPEKGDLSPDKKTSDSATLHEQLFRKERFKRNIILAATPKQLEVLDFLTLSYSGPKPIMLRKTVVKTLALGIPHRALLTRITEQANSRDISNSNSTQEENRMKEIAKWIKNYTSYWCLHSNPRARDTSVPDWEQSTPSSERHPFPLAIVHRTIDAFQHISAELRSFWAIADVRDQLQQVCFQFGFFLVTPPRQWDEAGHRERPSSELMAELVEQLSTGTIQHYFLPDTPRSTLGKVLRSLRITRAQRPTTEAIITVQALETLARYVVHAVLDESRSSEEAAVPKFIITDIHNVGITCTWDVLAFQPPKLAVIDEATGMSGPAPAISVNAAHHCIPLELSVLLHSKSQQTAFLDKAHPFLHRALNEISKLVFLVEPQLTTFSEEQRPDMPILSGSARSDDHFEILSYRIERVTRSTTSVLEIEEVEGITVEYPVSLSKDDVSVMRLRNVRMLWPEDARREFSLLPLDEVQQIYEAVLRG